MTSPRGSTRRDGDGVVLGGTRWKAVSSVRLQRYGFEFDALVRGEAHERGVKRVSGGDAAPLLASLGASREALRHIWNLADTDATGFLRFDEFVIACYLAEREAQGQTPPASLEGFPLGTFPPRAEGAAEPLVKPPTPPVKQRITEVKPFALTPPGSFNEFTKKREKEESEQAAVALSEFQVQQKENKFADQERLESLHQHASRRSMTLESEREKAEAERLANEKKECTFEPEKMTRDEDKNGASLPRKPLQDRASGIIVARDQKRWLAGELAKREEQETFKKEVETNLLKVDLEVDPDEFAVTTAARWEAERQAKEKALEKAREDLLRFEQQGGPRFIKPEVPGLEKETWTQNSFGKRSGPWHERLSKTEPKELPKESNDRDSPAPTVRPADALHTARALHIEAQLREKRREAEREEVRDSAKKTASAKKLSAKSGDSHAWRTRQRLVSVMRLARVLLAGDVTDEIIDGTAGKSPSASITTLPKEAIARVLRATKMLPSTVPDSLNAQRDEQRKMYRLCSALSTNEVSDDPTSDTNSLSVSVVLLSRCIGAAVQSSLQRSGVAFDKQTLLKSKEYSSLLSDASDAESNVIGDEFDKGRTAFAYGKNWWPKEWDAERVDLVQDAFKSIAGQGAASENLSRTPIKEHRERSSMTESNESLATHTLKTERTSGTPSKPTDVADRLAQRKANTDAQIEAARVKRDEEEQAECTFAPKITPRPASSFSRRAVSAPSSPAPSFSKSRSVSGRVFSPGRAVHAMREMRFPDDHAGDVYADDTRNVARFSSVTGERLESNRISLTSRETSELKELQECTFAPKVNRFPSYLKIPRSGASTSKAKTKAATVYRHTESAKVRKPWEPLPGRDTIKTRTKRPSSAFSSAPPGFENTVRRMRSANEQARTRRESELSTVERRASWVDPRELRQVLRSGTQSLKMASPKHVEIQKIKRQASLLKFKESRQRSTVKRLSSAKPPRDSVTSTKVTSMTSLTPVLTKEPEMFSFANSGTDDGLPPVPPSTLARVRPATLQIPGSPRESTPRSPRSPIPLDEASAWQTSPNTNSASKSPSAARSPRSPSSTSGSPVMAATLKMNKNAPSLLFTKKTFPGFPGSPWSITQDGGISTPGSTDSTPGSLDGYPYTKFVLGEPLVTLELTIGEAKGKTSTLTFHENETTKNAARRFCETHRLPKSTVRDVVVVLEEALRVNAVVHRANSVSPIANSVSPRSTTSLSPRISPGRDSSFRDELSPLWRDARQPTLADLAA